MTVLDRISDLKELVKSQKKAGKSIGFVPTMGYLHDGHVSLVKMSACNNDFTIVSIYVNPTQFGPNEDYSRYPRDMAGDIKKASEAGADVVFMPSDAEMYPDGYNTFIEVYGITDKLCGKSRPGHFRGVCTIVLKLFNIVEPERAYFGQKDAQQVAVVKKMAKDLNMETEIVTCPIIREKDGLAMSSRNVYLNAEERKAAPVLYDTLMDAEALVKNGERDCEKLREYIIGKIMREKLAVIDYVEILDAVTLKYERKLEGSVLVALAVKFGRTRLIDNIVLEVL